MGSEMCIRDRSDHAALCWGSDGDGQLGNPEPAGSPTPIPVETLSLFTSGIAAGELHACAIALMDLLACWGSNASHQLGSDAPGGATSEPTLVDSDRRWSKVSAGNVHSCAITTGRRLFCWGGNASGQLGLGALTAPVTHPAEVGLTIAPF